jgi:hypothetical protein
MRKLQRIFESTPEISFISPHTEFSLYWKRFLESELGGIYKAVPWKDLAKALNLKGKRCKRELTM